MALYQVAPALPDPYEFADKIADSLRFIDENPAATLRDLTPEMIDLWRIDPEELEWLRDNFDRLAAPDIHPHTVSSLIIFSRIYLAYYRIDDFADFENFADCYIKYQKLLCTSGHSFRLFDLENLD